MEEMPPKRLKELCRKKFSLSMRLKKCVLRTHVDEILSLRDLSRAEKSFVGRNILSKRLKKSGEELWWKKCSLHKTQEE